jgi:hypothetical protein
MGRTKWSPGEAAALLFPLFLLAKDEMELFAEGFGSVETSEFLTEGNDQGLFKSKPAEAGLTDFEMLEHDEALGFGKLVVQIIVEPLDRFFAGIGIDPDTL